MIKHIMQRAPSRFVLLYGSQTGQAKCIAEDIAEKAKTHGLLADLHCMSKVGSKFSIENESCVVFVVSTTGDGDYPDTALKFARRIKRKTLPCNYFQNIRFTLLGLGDSNYNNFCNSGKNINKRLLELGATHFYPPAWSDDGIGLEIVVDPWVDGLWAATKKELDLQRRNVDRSPENIIHQATMNFSSSEHLKLPPTARSLPNQIFCNIHVNCEATHNEAVSHNVPNSENITAPSGNVAFEVSSQDLENDVAIGFGDSTSSFNASNIQTDKSEENSSLCDSVTVVTMTDFVNLDTKSENPLHAIGAKLKSEQNSSASDTVFTSVEKEAVFPFTAPNPKLAGIDLSFPTLQPCCLEILYDSINNIDVKGFSAALSDDKFQKATIVSAKQLTTHFPLVKKTLELCIDISSLNWDFEPGDAFFILCQNEVSEVDQLIRRLQYNHLADKPFTLRFQDNANKKRHLPVHITRNTVRGVLMYDIDIRTAASKVFLRSLAEFTSEHTEKRRLLELCSRQGSVDHRSHFYLADRRPTVLDLLLAFPSCQPPIEVLFQHLGALRARPYSITSSPLKVPDKVNIVFNVEEFTGLTGVNKNGLCTGWLNKITQHLQQQQPPSLEDDIAKLTITDLPQILVALRPNHHFRLARDVTLPVIMVGPGTGIAPFIGFLHQLEAIKQNNPTVKIGKTWLFYGCRFKNKDYLFRNEIQGFLQKEILSRFSVCFSRESASISSPRYVQDSIRQHASDIITLIAQENASVYICGDAKNMAKDVMKAFVDIYRQETGVTEIVATEYIRKLQEEKRYRQDVWA